jgi:hypothetical protein
MDDQTTLPQNNNQQSNISNITDTRDDPLNGMGIDPNTGDITDGAKESFRGATSVGGTNIGNPGTNSQGDATSGGTSPREIDTDYGGEAGVDFGYEDTTGVISGQNTAATEDSAISQEEYNTQDYADTSYSSNMMTEGSAQDDSVGTDITDLEGQGTAGNEGDLEDTGGDTTGTVRRAQDDLNDPDVLASNLVNE